MLYVLIVCALFSTAQAFNITLRTQNNSTSQPAKQAFNLVVEVSDGDRNTGRAVLDGLNQLQLIGQQNSNHMAMINGVLSSNVSYHFTVAAAAPGTITIGPAKVHHQGREVASNILTLTITPPSQAAQQQSAGKQNGMSTKLTTNKNEAVLGEVIELSFTLMSNQPIIEAAMGKFESPDFTIKELKQLQQRQEVINGTVHNISEKKYLLTPHKEGSFTLGPITLEAMVPVQRQRRSNGGVFDDDFFATFFGNQAERVQLKTNPVAITVKPLPTDQHIDGVGDFTKYTATLSAGEAHTHEPLTFTLDLEGKGDLDHITIPKLKLPPSIKYYESKNETIEDANNPLMTGKKHFEFVLQATHPGTFTIPAQTFVYFDTNTRQIKTLHSTQLNVSITGNPTNTQIETGDRAEAKTTPPDHEPEKSDKPIPIKNPTTPPAALPWWAFALLLLIPLPFLAKQIIELLKTVLAYIYAKQSRTKAHYNKTFKALIKKQDLDGIYTFFMNYISQKNNIASASLSMDDVEAYLIQRSFEYEKIDDFMSFLGSCSGGKYASHNLSPQEKESLLSKAHYWFLMLL